jgi:MFS family permease
MNNIKKLQIITLINGMTFYTPIFTLFLLIHNLNLGFIVAAQTMFTVGMLISTIPTGVLADKWGQKRAMQIGLILIILTMLSLVILHTPLMLLLFFVFRGIGVGFIDGADEALLYDSYVHVNTNTNGYTRAFGKMLSNDTLGFVVATAVAGIAVQIFGKTSYIPLIVATATASTIALIITSTLQPLEHIMVKAQGIKFVNQIKSGLKVVKQTRTIFALTILGLLTLNGEYFLRQTYQPYFQNLAVPAIFLGLALSGGKLLNFFAMRNVHHLEKFFTVDKMLLWINLALGASFILLAFANSVFLVVAVFMLIQAIMNSQQPIVSDYVNQQIQPGQRTTTLSTVSFIQNIGQIIARLLLGISIGLIGLGHTYIAQGIYVLAGTVIGIWYIRSCGCVHRIHHSMDSIPEAM